MRSLPPRACASSSGSAIVVLPHGVYELLAVGGLGRVCGRAGESGQATQAPARPRQPAVASLRRRCIRALRQVGATIARVRGRGAPFLLLGAEADRAASQANRLSMANMRLVSGDRANVGAGSGGKSIGENGSSALSLRVERG